MPDASCRHCHTAAPRQQWIDAPGHSFAFRIVCPACGVESDIADIELRMTTTPVGDPPPTSEPRADVDLW